MILKYAVVYERKTNYAAFHLVRIHTKPIEIQSEKHFCPPSAYRLSTQQQPILSMTHPNTKLRFIKIVND